MLVVLKVQPTTYVIVIKGIENKFISKFYHSDSISKFWRMNNGQQKLLLLISLALKVLVDVSII